MAAPLRYLLAKAGARCAAAFYAHGGALRASDAAVVRARARARARACARARARALLVLVHRPPSASRARRARRARRGPRSWSSFVVLVVNIVPLWFSLSALSSCSSYLFCLHACPPAGRAAQGEPPRDSGQRSRAKLCAHLFDVPICLSGLRRRSTT